MFRVFTAMLLLLLMTATSVMSQSGLKYCLCLQEISFGDSGCHVEAKAKTCHGGGSCGSHSEDFKPSELRLDGSQDCYLDLSFESLEFTERHGSARDLLKWIAELETDHYATENFVILQRNAETYLQADTSPQFREIMRPLPLYLRHTVFLI